jgi:hypothetical protein
VRGIESWSWTGMLSRDDSIVLEMSVMYTAKVLLACKSNSLQSELCVRVP